MIKLVRLILCFPHLILYLLLKEKSIVDADVNRFKTVYNMHTEIKMHSLFLLLNYRPEFRNIFYFRIKNYERIQRILSFLLRPYPLLFLGSQVKIKPGGLFLYHPFSTFINAKSIGFDCIIRQNTTIGNASDDNSKIPVIGDNVQIGANVVIIGDIAIGSNVVIGAGSVVTKNVPENCTVAGNPARIIRKNGIKCNELL